MAKPIKTPLRRAIDYLQDEGIITNDKDLLDLFELKSTGALSAYINGTPSKKAIRAFRNKFGEQVAHFFNDEAIDERSEKGAIPAREFIESLKSDKVFYQGVIEKNLASINTTLAKLVQIHESISSGPDQSAQKKTVPIVDPQALNPVVPVPPHRKSAKTQVSSGGSTLSKGSKNKGSGHHGAS